MKKVENANQAIEVFQLLGIKDVTKDWQRNKGTKVFELPFKTMYSGGYKEVNRFAIYKSGYVRKMLVNSKGASWCCYQLNKVRKVTNFVKDYKWNYEKEKSEWTGKYRKVYNNERIMIPKYEDRIVYLCNYILKNYYRKQSGASFYRINDYQVSLMKRNQEDSCELDRIRRPEVHNLPFDSIPSKYSKDNVQVIINGHRYNLS